MCIYELCCTKTAAKICNMPKNNWHLLYNNVIVTSPFFYPSKRTKRKDSTKVDTWRIIYCIVKIYTFKGWVKNKCHPLQFLKSHW